MARLTKKQKILAAFAVLLVLVVALVNLRPAVGNLPTPQSLDKREDELSRLQSRLERLERQGLDKDAELSDLRAQSRTVIWQTGDRVPSTVLQNELQGIARRERVTLRSVGSPRTREAGDNLLGIEVSVRIQGDMREVGRFLASLDAASPRLFWTTCTIRPVNLRQPDILDLSGRIEALFATGASEQLIFGDNSR